MYKILGVFICVAALGGCGFFESKPAPPVEHQTVGIPDSVKQQVNDHMTTWLNEHTGQPLTARDVTEEMSTAYSDALASNTLAVPLPDSGTDYGGIALHYLPWAIVGLCISLLLTGAFYQIPQQHRGIIERFGKYVRTTHPGLRLKIPFAEHVVDIISLQLRPLPVTVMTKTEDNVFTEVGVTVQYRVLAGHESDAFYQLEDEKAQITSYVQEVIGSKVPGMTLDYLFQHRNDIGVAVNEKLNEAMSGYGYEITATPVTVLDPAEEVQEAMNEIQKQTRLQAAAEAEGAAKKIRTIKAAEAEAEAKKLQGEGIANQRKAIVEGLKSSVEDFSKATGVDANEVLNLVLLTQYFDTVKEIGQASGSKVIFTPYQPGGLSDLKSQIQTAIIGGNIAAS